MLRSTMSTRPNDRLVCWVQIADASMRTIQKRGTQAYWPGAPILAAAQTPTPSSATQNEAETIAPKVIGWIGTNPGKFPET
jgi:hypothetical protein